MKGDKVAAETTVEQDKESFKHEEEDFSDNNSVGLTKEERRLHKMIDKEDGNEVEESVNENKNALLDIEEEEEENDQKV